jgi:uncharacterized protein
LYERLAQSRVEEALSDTRVVLISGPRQAGKTTLISRFTGDGRAYFTLDDATVRNIATSDPVGFLRGIEYAAIDEVQRAPDLLLAIKQSVDTDKRPGRFLLTGSANIMTIPRVADSLAGRMEIVPLLPLSQAEIAGSFPHFIERAFAGEVRAPKKMILGDDLVAVVLAGGYPEALARTHPRRRRKWYQSYVDALVQRDVRDVAAVDQLDRMPRLLRVLAEHSGQMINYSKVGEPLNLNHVTTQRYTGIFEHLFITWTLPPWHSNVIKRLRKTPKLHFWDSGLLADQRDLTADNLKANRGPLGALLETHVASELAKQTGWAEGRLTLSHFRDEKNNEVDIVIEDETGNVVGVEVKASATVNQSDFSGLRRLADACGDRFRLGVVLYDHDAIVPFGGNMIAAPISCLWN